MTDELTLQIQTTFAAVQSANETASRWLAERTTAAELQYFANLAIEEIATNCIKYGYDDAKNHVIEVKLSFSGSDVLVVTVVDDGHPFNPLEAREPDLSVPVEERPIGGLGIYLLRQLCDRMEYVREGGKNRLTLRKASKKH
jgi:anti-sigma regulatory factor (Ser/Thr protein kinase)